MLSNGNGQAHGKIVVAYPHGGSVRHCFMASMLAFREYDLAHKRRLAAVIHEQGLYVAHMRNKLVKRFLKTPAECEWLMMIDTDQQFDPHIPYQLVESAEEAGVTVMTALYFGILIDTVPMWWTRNAEGDMTTLADIKLDEIHELAGFGCGMFVVHRSVLEVMGERYKEDAYQWFAHDQVEFKGEPTRMGEDLCFCQRLTDMGIPMYGDARVRIGHDKSQLITLDSFLKTYVPREAGVPPIEKVLEG